MRVCLLWPFSSRLGLLPRTAGYTSLSACQTSPTSLGLSVFEWFATFSYVVLSIFAGLEISHWPMLFAVSTYVARYSPSLGYSPGSLPWGG